MAGPPGTSRIMKKTNVTTAQRVGRTKIILRMAYLIIFTCPTALNMEALLKSLYPTPTLSLPLKGRGIVTRYPRFLPFQGGGQEGDGGSTYYYFTFS
jgi:hypothetical protein